MGINTRACDNCDNIFYEGNAQCCYTCGSSFCGYCDSGLNHCNNDLDGVQEKMYMQILIEKLKLKSRIYNDADDPSGDLFESATLNSNNGNIVIDMDHLFESYPNLNNEMYVILLENGINLGMYCHESHPYYGKTYECVCCTKNIAKRKINFKEFFGWLFKKYDMNKEKLIKEFLDDIDNQ